MPARPPLKTVSANKKATSKSATTTPAGKRKSTDDIQPEKPSKARRTTLDAFFAPKVQLDASTKREPEPNKRNVVLNDEQSTILKMVLEGKNVFFTGSAGTGKSLLLRAIISSLRKKHAKQPGAVSVTASTGMAASNIGGRSILALSPLSYLICSRHDDSRLGCRVTHVTQSGSPHSIHQDVQACLSA
ncbi:hypothetical protein NEOLEDRAFT_1113494, partial [Neolentinus lepideus HHB14362 ss-1]